MTFLLAVVLAAADAGVAAPPEPALRVIQRLAKQQAPKAKGAWVKAWLEAAQDLPPVQKRTFYCSKDRVESPAGDAGLQRRCVGEKDAAALGEAERGAMIKKDVDDEFYYARITEPLGYLRPFELLAAQGLDPKGKRLLDFGYGNIGQLAMLARIGADVTGIEVDPLLPLIYAEAVGQVRGRGGVMGKLRVLHGYFPKDAELVREVGGKLDLFISKNTLKRGYVHPEQPVPERQRIDLGVSDEVFVKTVYELLNPGGYLFIYNLHPAPAPEGKPFLPMSDGRCPFSKETLEKAGFEVLSYDADDAAAARAMGKALGWDKGPESPLDLERDLFAHFTLARRPAVVKR